MSDEGLEIAGTFPALTAQDWRAKVEADLRGGSFAKLSSTTPEGLTLEPLYGPADDLGADASGFPGVPPFTRGRAALSSPGGWDIRQAHGHPAMDVCAHQLGVDVEGGVSSFWLSCGPEHGTRILSPGDLDKVLAAVDLENTAVSLDPGPDPLPVAAALVAVAKSRGVAPEALEGSFGCDPLGWLARKGSLPSGFGGARRDMVELASWSDEHTPRVRSVHVATQAYHDAGATAVQELAWAMATGVSYLRTLVLGGLSIDKAARQLLFSFSVGPDFFLQLAKLRAARVLWSKVVAAAGGSEAARAMVLHASTSAHAASRRDPWVNMLRTTTECFAAALGGADSVACAPFDEALGPADDLARRVARNTQLVLREEAHLARVTDPAGGSWFLESLTNRLARVAWDEFRFVEERGGMEWLLRHGKVRSALLFTAGERRRRIASRAVPLVGVSEFANLDEEVLERLTPSREDLDAELGNDFGDVDAETRYQSLLGFARTVARSSAPAGCLMDAAVVACDDGVDVASLAGLLAEGRPCFHMSTLTAWRASDEFDGLRDAADAHFEKTGAWPRAFLLNLGPLAEHEARSTWATAALAAGGIEAVVGEGVEDVASAVAAYQAAGCVAAVVCGSDARYEAMGAEIAAALTELGAPFVGLAGKSSEVLSEAGVALFLYAGCDLVATLQSLQQLVGVGHE